MTGSAATPPGKNGKSAPPGLTGATDTTPIASTASTPTAATEDATAGTKDTTTSKDATASASTDDAGTGTGGRSGSRSPTTTSADGAAAPVRTRRRLYWLVPVLAFVGGLLLGGGVIAAADLGSSDQPAAVPSSPAPAPAGPATEPGATTITVPASCADGLDKADAAVQAARAGVTGAGQLDTAAIRRALEQLRTLQPQIRELATQCRSGVSVNN